MRVFFIFVLIALSNFSIFDQSVNAAETSKPGYLTMSDGTNIFYEVSGKGEPLLLIHGGDTLETKKPYSSSVFKAGASWESQFKAFSRYFKVIRFDIRGFGKSDAVKPHPIDSWSWKNAEDRTLSDVVELLNALKIENTHVLGLSIGSAVAGKLTASFPDKINKLMLVSPWYDHTFTFSSEQQVKELNKLKDKTLLVVGKKDGYSLNETKAGKERGYEPETIVVENASHFVNSDQPEVFNKIALDHFKKQP